MGLRFCLAALLILASLMQGASATVRDATEGPPSTPSTSPSLPEETPQNLQCDLQDFCPEFLSRGGWDKLTDECCPAGWKDSGLTLHAQRTEGGGCVLACLPPTVCQAGEISILHEHYVDDIRYAFIKCEPCSNNTFEPAPLASYLYRDPTCRYIHQNCHASTKALVRAGNSTHDSTCRCLWEQGFAPFPDTSACREGFHSNMICACRRFYCQEDLQLNDEYKCVPAPPSTKMSTKADQGVETTEAIAPKPTGDKDDTGQPNPSGPEGWIWYLTAVVSCLLATAVFIMCQFHP